MKRPLLTLALLLLMLCAPVARAQISLEASAGLTTKVTGSLAITLDGDWTTLGSFIADSSTVTLNGDSTQTITNASGPFHNLILNKPGGDALAGGSFTVEGTLMLTEGGLDLNGHVVTLGSEALLVETAGHTVKGTTGYLQTTRVLDAPAGENVAGLGFALTSDADLGSTVIRRGHAAQSGNGNQSILRYFDVVPTNNSGLDATVVFHYDEHELEGQDEALLQLFHSTDDGSNWTAEGGMGDVGANTITLGGVVALSRWTAAQDLLTEAEPTSVETEMDLPVAYALRQNYPNPFNPTTAIDFALPEASEVRLVVYNVLGREVARLVEGPMEAGQHAVRFEASRLPSGVYLYRLEAGSFVAVRQMLLVK